MPTLTADRTHARLTAEGGIPLFLLADDVRGATAHAALSDWNDYLAIRQRQGFNAVLVDAVSLPEQLERMNELVNTADSYGMYVLAWREGRVAQATPATPRVLCGAAQGEADLHVKMADVDCDSPEGLPQVQCVEGGERAETRAVLWRAILGGAFGGVVLSAPGLSSWGDPNAGLACASAEDFAFAKQAVDYFDLTWGEPWNEAVVQGEGAVCARTSSTALIYVPSSYELLLNGDFTESFVQAIDLTSGEGTRLDFAYDGNLSHVPAHPFSADSLYVIRL